MSVVDRWTALRDRSRDDVEHAATAAAPGVAYNRIEAVDRYSTPEGEFYFRGPNLVMVHISERVLRDEPAGPVIAELGDGERLQSRAGKDSILWVWADRGLAASVSYNDRLEFVEVFPPTTIEHYRDAVYREPRPFIR
jgi:hypothetical protein